MGYYYSQDDIDGMIAAGIISDPNSSPALSDILFRSQGNGGLCLRPWSFVFVMIRLHFPQLVLISLLKLYNPIRARQLRLRTVKCPPRIYMRWIYRTGVFRGV
jgi:hypothetical protein